MPYLHWDQQTLPPDASPEAIAAMYGRGYLFGRLGKTVMQQTRSCRIDLARFELSSENRRILRKTADLKLRAEPLPYAEYDYKLGKLAKDFYDTKFGPGTMSANKAKELMTDPAASSFDRLLVYLNGGDSDGDSLASGVRPLGYAICYAGPTMLHYSYPFYDLAAAPKDMGMGMMVRAIQYAQEKGLAHIYLGSLQRPGDTYKLQFAGLEWFDGEKWRTDTEEVKRILSNNR